MHKSLLKPVLSATLAVMTMGVVSLEIVVALSALEGEQPGEHRNPSDDELWSQSNR